MEMNISDYPFLEKGLKAAPYVFSLLFGAKVLKIIYRKYNYRKVTQKGRQIFKDKMAKQYQFKDVSQFKFIVDQSYSVEEVRRELIKGTFTVHDLISLYCHRCYTLGRELRLTTEELFDQALERATALDNELQTAIKNGTTDQLPSLFGIPFSIKDQFDFENTRTTVGCHFLADNIRERNNYYVRLFMEQGAVPIAKGNVPQALLAVNATNEIYGQCISPFNKERSTGGSTGGDSGLVASRCVMFAIGADLAGSIRIPCSFNGIKGLKLTSNRNTLKEMTITSPNSFCAFDHMRIGLGPLSRSMDGLIQLTKLMLDPKIHRFDPDVPPCPFNENLFQETLNRKGKIGYYDSLKSVPSTDAVKRAVRVAKEALEKQGYELVPFDFSLEDEKEAIELSNNFLIYTSLIPIFRHFRRVYEKPAPLHKGTVKFVMSSRPMKALLKFFFKITGNKRLGDKIPTPCRPPLRLIEQIVYKRQFWMERLRKRWQEQGLQAVICPAFPSCTFKVENAALGGLYDNTILWNLTNFPTGSVPVTLVEDGETVSYEDGYNDVITHMIRKDIQGSQGLPVGVQVVSWAFEDEACLAVMKAIDDEVRQDIIPKTDS